MTDFTNLISQAKKMQEKMKETQEALKKIEEAICIHVSHNYIIFTTLKIRNIPT